MGDTYSRRKVEIFKALAHPVRLRISEELIKGEKCVCDITALFSFDRTTISKHLSVLKSAGVIIDRKEGLFVFYSLNLKCLGKMLNCLSGSVEAELENHLKAVRMETKFQRP
ncbi:MAG: metalloregulator ArsR/SmtB family transcription factor [Thermovirgaceae bacterium]|nr:metalloregulator ArsR/SmtB family transcription factor [Thermovirgaceae bacterium]